MNSLLIPYQYLTRLFPPEFVAALTKEDYLYRLLTDEDSELDELRNNVNECLELAYRYDLADADLEARLKKGDQESWQAAMNELSVARIMEVFFGRGCLRWHPQGKNQKVGEYELVTNKTDTSIFAEVKTVFPRDMERLENRIIYKLRRYAEQVSIPSFLSVYIEVPGTSESISGRRFKDFLSRELSAINPNNLAKKESKLPDYKDNSTGLHLKIETLAIKPKKEEQDCHIGVIGGGAKCLENDAYIKHSLSKAYKQLPSGEKRCLVIICPSTAFPIDEDDMLNALLGHLAVRYYWQNGEPTKEPETIRKPDGFYRPNRNRRVSAVGLYKGRNVKNPLEIYHNPCTTNPIPQSIFMEEGIRQLVKVSDTEMKWIE